MYTIAAHGKICISLNTLAPRKKKLMAGIRFALTTKSRCSARQNLSPIQRYEQFTVEHVQIATKLYQSHLRAEADEYLKRATATRGAVH